MSIVNSPPPLHSGLPSPSLWEQTGESLLVAEPCWLLRWSLTDQQQSALQAILSSQALTQTLDHAVPEKFRLLVSEAIQSSVQHISLLPAEALSSPLGVRIIVAVAQACGPDLDLNTVPFKAKRGLVGGGVALRSSRHPLAGMVLRWVLDLLSTVAQCSPNEAKHADWKRLLQQCAQWSELMDRLNEDLLLSAMLEQSAQRRIPVYLPDGMTGIWQFGMGCNSRLVYHSASDLDSQFGVRFAKQKRVAREWMKRLGCSVPSEVAVFGDHLPEQTLQQVVNRLGFPCVAKPEAADRGVGVTAGIQSVEELQSAIAKAHGVSKGCVLLQSHVPGADHRLYVIDGQLTHVIRRDPPCLIGNGRESLEQLFLAENERRRDLARRNGITQQLDSEDPEIQKRLLDSGYTWDSVLPEGECVQLRSTATVHTGGVRTVLKVGDVHPVLRRQCEEIARTFRLHICGLDFIGTDLTADPRGGSGAFIEVNSCPETPPDRAEDVLTSLFPDLNALIPVDVWIADWPRLQSEPEPTRLFQLLQDHASAILAIPHAQRSAVAAFLPLEASERLQGFDHVHEPVFNRAATSLVFLLTPDYVLQNGMPHPTVRAVHTLALDLKIKSHSRVLDLVKEIAV